MSTEIAIANLGDLLHLRTLWLQMVAAEDRPYPTVDDEDVTAWTVQMAARLERADPFTRTWLAWQEGEPVGMLSGEIQQRFVGKPRHFGSCHWLFVTPEARGGKVAPLLIRTGVEWLATHDITVVELVSMAGDTQWVRRHWRPVTVRYMMPIAELVTRYGSGEPARPAREKEGMNGQHQ